MDIKLTTHEKLEIKYITLKSVTDSLDNCESIQETMAKAFLAGATRIMEIKAEHDKTEREEMDEENERQRLQEGVSYYHDYLVKKEADKAYQNYLVKAKKGLALKAMDEAAKNVKGDESK